jgi:hypothetical protein
MIVQRQSSRCNKRNPSIVNEVDGFLGLGEKLWNPTLQCGLLVRMFATILSIYGCMVQIVHAKSGQH